MKIYSVIFNDQRKIYSEDFSNDAIFIKESDIAKAASYRGGIYSLKYVGELIDIPDVCDTVVLQEPNTWALELLNVNHAQKDNVQEDNLILIKMKVCKNEIINLDDIKVHTHISKNDLFYNGIYNGEGEIQLCNTTALYNFYKDDGKYYDRCMQLIPGLYVDYPSGVKYILEEKDFKKTENRNG